MGAWVFDLDGVIVDSEPVWEEVRRAFVAEHGGTWQPDTQSRLMGMSTPEWAAYLHELGVTLPPGEIARQVVARMAERYREHVPLMPHARDAVLRLAGRHTLGLASSSPRALIDVVLDAAGLESCFAATVSTEEVARGKPAPDGYLEAAARLGVDPRTCVAVEDSSNGLRSAHAAGMRVVAVPHPRYPPAPDALSLAWLVVPDLAELPEEPRP
ncbi:HAD family hydrolase [Nonomuraea sp. NPDC047897]|uniref:HAD family hydrolase n=1 Tax=Nonomuraea sp. NPDC047897 TaxID=3364346 RepID=UPI003717956B